MCYEGSTQSLGCEPWALLGAGRSLSGEQLTPRWQVKAPESAGLWAVVTLEAENKK